MSDESEPTPKSCFLWATVGPTTPRPQPRKLLQAKDLVHIGFVLLLYSHFTLILFETRNPDFFAELGTPIWLFL